MILPPLVHAPFHYSHRAEARERPYLSNSALEVHPRLVVKTVLLAFAAVMLLALLVAK